MNDQKNEKWEPVAVGSDSNEGLGVCPRCLERSPAYFHTCTPSDAWRVMEQEWSRYQDLLRDWLKFAADVQPNDAAGADWLDHLRQRTEIELSA